MRIPVTMCHGIELEGYPPQIPHPLRAERLTELMKIAHDMGFESISYDDIDAWRNSGAGLPRRPIVIDFDHPVRSLRHEVLEILDRFGFAANLFIYTRPYDPTYERPLNQTPMPEHMTWQEIRELVAAGWRIGAHTVTHPNLSDLSIREACRAAKQAGFDGLDLTLSPGGYVKPDNAEQGLAKAHEIADEEGVSIPMVTTGIAAADSGLASGPSRSIAGSPGTSRKTTNTIVPISHITGTSWSTLAEIEVKKRYRFGRLWIVGSDYTVDGNRIRYADLVRVSGADEDDGGPPFAARYIDGKSDPYRLPSMDLQALINSPDAFRRYLEGALRDE